MKQFFRLLFICVGLFLLLGMTDHHAMDHADQAAETPALTSLDVQAGTFAEGPGAGASPHVFNGRLIPAEAFCTTPHQEEYSTSAGIRTRLLFFKESYMKYSPGIPAKKGMHQFHPAQKGDPFLA